MEEAREGAREVWQAAAAGGRAEAEGATEVREAENWPRRAVALLAA